MLDADHPREACGVFGVWAPGEPVANLTFYGLYALQHRGQESAGMAVGDGHGLLVYKEMGLVSQVFDGPTLATLQGHLAIGHTRYSTTSSWENAQPTFKTNAAGGGIALAHNGNLTNTAALSGQLIPQESPPGWPVPPRPTSDTDVMAEPLAREADLSLEEAIVHTMGRLEALTETAALPGPVPPQGLCTACFTGSIPIPDAAGPDPTPSAATQPSTLPLPNP
jgi:amidophosphoribosyltransferase